MIAKISGLPQIPYTVLGTKSYLNPTVLAACLPEGRVLAALEKRCRYAFPISRSVLALPVFEAEVGSSVCMAAAQSSKNFYAKLETPHKPDVVFRDLEATRMSYGDFCKASKHHQNEDSQSKPSAARKKLDFQLVRSQEDTTVDEAII